MALLFLGALSSLGVALSSGGLTAQERVEIATESLCDTCLALEHLVTLGDSNDPVGFGRFSKTVQDGRGRYYVAPTFDMGRVLVYDSTGTFMSVFGQAGGGPKELGRIRRFRVSTGDSLHILHGGRYTVVSPTHVVVRTQIVRVNTGEFAVLRGGQLVVGGVLGTRAGAGYPLHLLEGDSVVRSFGLEKPDQRLESSILLKAHRVANGSNGRVWLGHYNQYQLELWDTTGTRIRTLRRDADWFVPWQSFTGGPTRPVMADVQQDINGYLWVLVAVPLRSSVLRFRREQGFQAREQPVMSVSEESSAFYTMIEVIDPDRGEMVASRRVDDLVVGFASDSTIYVRREDVGTGLVIDVLVVRLKP